MLAQKIKTNFSNKDSRLKTGFILKPGVGHFRAGFLAILFMFFGGGPHYALASPVSPDEPTTIVLAKNSSITPGSNDQVPGRIPAEKMEAIKIRKAEISFLEEQARGGSAEAQTKLGYIYYYGWGVDIDHKKAVGYHEKAAQKGYAAAQYALGDIYSEYEGALWDYNKAVYWLEKAAEQGDAEAQLRLGGLYKNFGVFLKFDKSSDKNFENSEKLADYWLEKSAKQGNAAAMGLLKKRGVTPKYREWTSAELVEVRRAMKEEMRLLHQKAEQGDIMAQFNLGIRYYNTQFVETDYPKAIYWFEQAAEGGHAAAQYRLGEIYLYGGADVKKDTPKGIGYLEQAARKGHADSQFRLGFIYFDEGNGDPEDYPKAARHFEQAAQQGYAAAQYWLALMYAEGHGVPKNLEKAEYYMAKSEKQGGPSKPLRSDYLRTKEKAEQGSADAQLDLANMYYDGEISVPQDFKKARYWLERAVEQFEQEAKDYKVTKEDEYWVGPAGYDYFTAALAQVKLARMYINSEGGEQNIKKAVYWLEQADAHGDISAPYHLGCLYLEGQGLKQDSQRARAYFEDAAQRSIAFAGASWVELGGMYAFGKGSIAQDYKKARKYYEQASDHGSATAQYRLGSLYYEGQGVSKDLNKALHWYKKAAQQGHPTAQANLGVMYSNGEGVKKDLTQSLSWFRKAAHQGYAPAIRALGNALEHGLGTPKNIPQAYGYVLVLMRLKANDEHYQHLGKLQIYLLDKYQLSPQRVEEAETFAAKVLREIKASGHGPSV